jgi:predicted nucleic acid-binding protein
MNDMYLWDSNIFRYFGQENTNLMLHLKFVEPDEIALPSVVVAEILKGRSEFALKAEPHQLPSAHKLLFQTQKVLNKFKVEIFNEQCLSVMEKLKRKHKSKKRHADMLIAATAISGNHILVTRNKKHFEDLLPKKQIENWIDGKPNK